MDDRCEICGDWLHLTGDCERLNNITYRGISEPHKEIKMKRGKDLREAMNAFVNVHDSIQVLARDTPPSAMKYALEHIQTGAEEAMAISLRELSKTSLKEGIATMRASIERDTKISEILSLKSIIYGCLDNVTSNECEETDEYKRGAADVLRSLGKVAAVRLDALNTVTVCNGDEYKPFRAKEPLKAGQDVSVDERGDVRRLTDSGPDLPGVSFERAKYLGYIA